MKIQCPKCRRTVPSDQINISTNLALCPLCNEGFKISESLDIDSVSADILQNPPNGAWFKRDMSNVIVGATTRSPIAFFLVPFMCVWSGVSLFEIYGSQFAKGQFELSASLFGIPFLIGSIILLALVLMAVCGKVEVCIGDVSSVSVGIGFVGWTRRFDWLEVRTIRESGTKFEYPGGHQRVIVLEGSTSIKFGTGLNEKRRYFVFNALKYLKAKSR
jgi:hypothetical protein